MKRSTLLLVLVAAMVTPGCSGSTDPGRPGCAGAAGVWDLTRVSQTGTGITCPETSLVWTLSQTGCDFTVASQAWDPANGATGAIWDSRLYAQWSWRQDCYQVTESIDVTVDGGTMTGEYFLLRSQAVYPAYCPGIGMCSASLSGVRRAP